ncbi:dihydrolipoamide acetyltransferase family protein [Peribacillus alkalitolerans]|uniref:dihydrolipoamide acetyltransferase family protein n=1 Tax=Peribacillus alkalitolerans TaxID=1550385 RepID=UPI0013D1020F|nr:dihydrolipoamide acetyltransferase family protein [Peribacillus alkalitolerans]
MEVKLHDIGEGMTEADINHFFVKPGDYVKADDPLVEVQTDKMTAEIPSPYSGIVKELKVRIGSTIPVGTTVLILESEQKNTSKPSQINLINDSDRKINELNRNIEFSPEMDRPSYKRIMASPYTRKIARENGIQIEDVIGTGPAGRITDEDVYSFIKGAKVEPVVMEVTTIPTQETVPSKSIPYKGRRKQIGKKMAQSLYTIPHCTHFEEIDVTELIALRELLKAQGKSISATVFFMKALTICLKEFPIFNASIDEENEIIHLHDAIHIGIATDTSEGLIVPVLRHVEQKSLKSLHEEMKNLTDKAIAGQLKVNECTGSTFTISNVGPLGGSIGATPIINPPEVGLMAFHKTKKRPVVNEKDEIVVRSMMNISMSYDHRVVDGATAVQFTNRFALLIENPTLIFVELM